MFLIYDRGWQREMRGWKSLLTECARMRDSREGMGEEDENEDILIYRQREKERERERERERD